MSSILFLSSLFLFASGVSGGQDEDRIRNPYFEKTQWKVWRLNSDPVKDARAYVPPSKEVPGVIQVPEAAKQIWPYDDREKIAAYAAPKGKKYAGIWDDVYASWSGTHGYVRDWWRGPGGQEVKGVKNAIIHLVDSDPGQNIFKCGINFFHQSTTGMGHTIANGVQVSRTEGFERIYFASGLITSPAHVSFTEESAKWAAQTNDLYMALFPTYFNSVGSSNSETMAITKMIIAGGYLPPETKLLLKRHGLYAGAMLYMWKASLPYKEPYDSELRHRIGYKACGDRYAIKGYGAAGITRGDMCLGFYQYDDNEHMRRMIAMAKGMKIAPPEAVLKVLERSGGTERYVLKKSVCIIQEEGQEITLKVSAADSYDLQNRPLTHRLKLLYGNKKTTVEREGDVYTIKVPWDERLPEGRTVLLLVANNGVYDSNPAAISIYRKRGELPGTGFGPKDYKYDVRQANKRPVIVGLQDHAVKPGETLRIPVRAIDPEGFPLTFYTRDGEPGAFDGNVFVWKVPRNVKPGDHVVTIIGSDGTSGNSYEAQQIKLQVAPKMFGRIKADKWSGAAPLTVNFSAEASGAQTIEWGVKARAPGPPKMPNVEGKQASFAKTFDKPGIYEVWLKVKGPGGEDTATSTVYVTGAVPTGPSRLVVEGNGAEIGDRPSFFTHTDYGKVEGGEEIIRDFLLMNAGGGTVKLGKVALEGAPDFEIVHAPRAELKAHESTRISIRFSPRGRGERTAVVRAGSVTFPIRGEGHVDQERIDRQAEPSWKSAKRQYELKRYEKAIEALRKLVSDWPDATQKKEAEALLAKMESDPAVKAAIEKAKADAERRKNAAAQDKKARRIYNLARNYKINGLTSRAEEMFRKIIKEYPDSEYAKKAKKELGD